MVGFVGAEGMERGEGVDVTTHMITHAYSLKLSLNLFIAGMCWHCQTKCTLYIIVFIQTMKLNNVQLV